MKTEQMQTDSNDLIARLIAKADEHNHLPAYSVLLREAAAELALIRDVDARHRLATQAQPDGLRAFVEKESRRVEWEGDDDQQWEARQIACKQRCDMMGDSECDGDGTCSECDSDMADTLETDASKRRRARMLAALSTVPQQGVGVVASTKAAEVQCDGHVPLLANFEKAVFQYCNERETADTSDNSQSQMLAKQRADQLAVQIDNMRGQLEAALAGIGAGQEGEAGNG